MAFDVFVGLPIVLFVVFASQFRLSWRKLRRARDLVMPTYYALLWLVCLLNLLRVALRCGARIGEDTPAIAPEEAVRIFPAAWTALWLATRFGATFAEVVLASSPARPASTRALPSAAPGTVASAAASPTPR